MRAAALKHKKQGRKTTHLSCLEMTPNVQPLQSLMKTLRGQQQHTCQAMYRLRGHAAAAHILLVCLRTEGHSPSTQLRSCYWTPYVQASNLKCVIISMMACSCTHLLSVGPMMMWQFLQSSMVTLAHASITYSWQSCSRGNRAAVMM